jgi:pimeloyl-ACP methyl ester carboxylesterase
MKALTIHPLSTHSKRVLFALLTCATGCASAASGSDPTVTALQAVSEHNRDRWEAKHCNDDDIESVTRTDYLLPITSDLPSPNNQGQAYLDIRVVKPVYKNHPGAPAYGSQCTPKGVVVGVHGRSIDSVTSFDAPYNDYSLAEALAKRGITSYLVNLLGTGLSSRFSLDNPCNTTKADQTNFLIPNPLSATCNLADPYVLTHTNAMVGQLDAVVDHAISETGVDAVSLFAWSRGGFVAGPYAERYPAKLKNMVFYAGNYIVAGGGVPVPDNPPPLPVAGVPGGVSSRAATLATWNSQISAACPGQRDPGILDPLWGSLMDRDPLGATWGSSGVARFPNPTLWGWNKKNAVHVTTPLLILSGLLDTSVPTAFEQQLYDDVASTKKVLVKMACASHYAVWEGSTVWAGPHSIVQRATADWIIGESFNGTSHGIFNVSNTGAISP